MQNKSEKLYTFIWEGINKDGMKISGKSIATHRKFVTRMIKEAGTTPLKIRKEHTSIISTIQNKATPQDIISFTKELSNLISAHIPLSNALEMSEKSANKTGLKAIIHKIKTKIASGTPLSEALRGFPKHFDDIYCSLIEAGEHSGTLDIMLENITQHQAKDIKLKRTIKKALLYPITVLFVSLFVTGMLFTFIIPQFANLFQTSGTDLPLLTNIIMSLSEKFQQHYKTMLITTFIFIISTKILISSSEKLLLLIDKLSLKIPLYGRILKLSIFTRCFNTLSVLLYTGIPLIEALNLTAKISNNRIYRKSFHDISNMVRSGNSLFESTKVTDQFPELVLQMISIGEASSTLEKIFKDLGIYFEERTDDIVYNLGQLLEPAIMIFLALIVGTVIIAMYLPIFNIGVAI